MQGDEGGAGLVSAPPSATPQAGRDPARSGRPGARRTPATASDPASASNSALGLVGPRLHLPRGCVARARELALGRPVHVGSGHGRRLGRRAVGRRRSLGRRGRLSARCLRRPAREAAFPLLLRLAHPLHLLAPLLESVLVHRHGGFSQDRSRQQGADVHRVRVNRGQHSTASRPTPAVLAGKAEEAHRARTRRDPRSRGLPFPSAAPDGTGAAEVRAPGRGLRPRPGRLPGRPRRS